MSKYIFGCNSDLINTNHYSCPSIENIWFDYLTTSGVDYNYFNFDTTGAYFSTIMYLNKDSYVKDFSGLSGFDKTLLQSDMTLEQVELLQLGTIGVYYIDEYFYSHAKFNISYTNNTGYIILEYFTDNNIIKKIIICKEPAATYVLSDNEYLVVNDANKTTIIIDNNILVVNSKYLNEVVLDNLFRVGFYGLDDLSVSVKANVITLGYFVGNGFISDDVYGNAYYLTDNTSIQFNKPNLLSYHSTFYYEIIGKFDQTCTILELLDTSLTQHKFRIYLNNNQCCIDINSSSICGHFLQQPHNYASILIGYDGTTLDIYVNKEHVITTTVSDVSGYVKIYPDDSFMSIGSISVYKEYPETYESNCDKLLDLVKDRMILQNVDVLFSSEFYFPIDTSLNASATFSGIYTLDGSYKYYDYFSVCGPEAVITNNEWVISSSGITLDDYICPDLHDKTTLFLYKTGAHVDGITRVYDSFSNYSTSANYAPGRFIKIKLEADHTKIDEELTDFPVLVILDSDYSEVFDYVLNPTSDITCFDSTQSEYLYCEVEHWDADNTKGILWVKLPSISASENTIFYIYISIYNTSVTTGFPGTEVGRAVWTNNYICVYHFNKTTGGYTFTDSATPVIPQLSTNNTSISFNDPGFGYGVRTPNYVVIDTNNQDYTLSQENITVSFLSRIDSSDIVDQVFFSTQHNFYINYVSTSDTEVVNYSTTLHVQPPVNEYFYLAVRGDSSGIDVYLNDALSVSTTEAYVKETVSDELLVAESKYYTRNFILASVSRSEAWLKAEYYTFFNNIVVYHDLEYVKNKSFKTTSNGLLLRDGQYTANKVDFIAGSRIDIYEVSLYDSYLGITFLDFYVFEPSLSQVLLTSSGILYIGQDTFDYGSNIVGISDISIVLGDTYARVSIDGTTYSGTISTDDQYYFFIQSDSSLVDSSVGSTYITVPDFEVPCLSNRFENYNISKKFDYITCSGVDLFYDTTCGEGVLVYDGAFKSVELSCMALETFVLNTTLTTSGYTYIGISEDFSDQNNFLKRWAGTSFPYPWYSALVGDTLPYEYSTCYYDCYNDYVSDGNKYNWIFHYGVNAIKVYNSPIYVDKYRLWVRAEDDTTVFNLKYTLRVYNDYESKTHNVSATISGSSPQYIDTYLGMYITEIDFEADSSTWREGNYYTKPTEVELVSYNSIKGTTAVVEDNQLVCYIPSFNTLDLFGHYNLFGDYKGTVSGTLYYPTSMKYYFTNTENYIDYWVRWVNSDNVQFFIRYGIIDADEIFSSPRKLPTLTGFANLVPGKYLELGHGSHYTTTGAMFYTGRVFVNEIKASIYLDVDSQQYSHITFFTGSTAEVYYNTSCNCYKVDFYNGKVALYYDTTKLTEVSYSFSKNNVIIELLIIGTLVEVWVNAIKILTYLDVARTFAGTAYGVSIYVDDWDYNNIHISRLRALGITDATTSSGTYNNSCDFVISTDYNDISELFSGNIITASGTVVSGTETLNLSEKDHGFTFYNADRTVKPVASGILYGVSAATYYAEFDSVKVGYSITYNDEKTFGGVSYGTYPPSVYIEDYNNSVDSLANDTRFLNTEYSFEVAKYLDLVSVSGSETAGSVVNTARYVNLSLVSDLYLVGSLLYKAYVLGKDETYKTFEDLKYILRSGDIVYLRKGTYSLSTDASITIVGLESLADILVSVDTTANISCYGVSIKGIYGSGVVSFYNCCILPVKISSTSDSTYIQSSATQTYFHNCDIYNNDYFTEAYSSNHFYFYNCIVSSSDICYYPDHYSLVVRVDDYKTTATYGYGVVYNKVDKLGGLSSVELIKCLFLNISGLLEEAPATNTPVPTTNYCGSFIPETTYQFFIYGELKNTTHVEFYIFLPSSGNFELINDFITVRRTNDLEIIVDINGLPIRFSYTFSREVLYPGLLVVSYSSGKVNVILNGSTIGTKYIYVNMFSTYEACFGDPLLSFNVDGFEFDNGLCYKGINSSADIFILCGAHDPIVAGGDYSILLEFELNTDDLRTKFKGSVGAYGYKVSGCGGVTIKTSQDYGTNYYNGYIRYAREDSITRMLYHNLYHQVNGVWKEVRDVILSPQKESKVLAEADRIDNYILYVPNDSTTYYDDAFGFYKISLYLPVVNTNRPYYCFDRYDSDAVVMVVANTSSINRYTKDLIGKSTLHSYSQSGSDATISDGLFHTSVVYTGTMYLYLDHVADYNLGSEFTFEFLGIYYKNNFGGGYVIRKGGSYYSYAYGLGINMLGYVYFIWSQDGNKTVYATKPLIDGRLTYVSVVVSGTTITFYINGEESGIHTLDRLDRTNNTDRLYIANVSQKYSDVEKSSFGFEEIYILNRAKTKSEIENTMSNFSDGKCWIKLKSITVITERPLVATPYDFMLPITTTTINNDLWDYVAYVPLYYTSKGLYVYSPSVYNLFSKVWSFRVAFDVRIKFKIADYSEHKRWKLRFVYKYMSGNYLSLIVYYNKEDIRVAYKYKYRSGVYTSSYSWSFEDEATVRFYGTFDRKVNIAFGGKKNLKVLWTSEQDMFTEAAGRLEVYFDNLDWDSWFSAYLFNFISSLYVSDSSGFISDFEGKPFFRDFYNEEVSFAYNTYILPNTIYDVVAEQPHSVYIVFNDSDSQAPMLYYNQTTALVNYSIVSIEFCINIKGAGTNIFNYYPYLVIEYDYSTNVVVFTAIGLTKTSTGRCYLPDSEYVYVGMVFTSDYIKIHFAQHTIILEVDLPLFVINKLTVLGNDIDCSVVFYLIYEGELDYNQMVERRNTIFNKFIGFNKSGLKVYGDNVVSDVSYVDTFYSNTCRLSYSLGSLTKTNILDVPYSLILRSYNCYLLFKASTAACINHQINSNGIETACLEFDLRIYNTSFNYTNSFGSLGSYQSETITKCGDVVSGVCYVYYRVGLEYVDALLNKRAVLITQSTVSGTIEASILFSTTSPIITDIPLYNVGNKTSLSRNLDYLTTIQTDYELIGSFDHNRSFVYNVRDFELGDDYAGFVVKDSSLNFNEVEYYYKGTSNYLCKYFLEYLDIGTDKFSIITNGYYTTLKLKCVLHTNGVVILYGDFWWNLKFKEYEDVSVATPGIYIVYSNDGISNISLSTTLYSLDAHLGYFKVKDESVQININTNDYIHVGKLSKYNCFVFMANDELVVLTPSKSTTFSTFPKDVDIIMDILVGVGEVSVYINTELYGTIIDSGFKYQKDAKLRFNYESIGTSSAIYINSLTLYDSVNVSTYLDYRFGNIISSCSIVSNKLLLTTGFTAYAYDLYNNTSTYVLGSYMYRDDDVGYNMLSLYAADKTYLDGLGYYGKVLSMSYKDGFLLILYESRFIVFNINGYVVRSTDISNISYLKVFDDAVYIYNTPRSRVYRIETSSFIEFDIPTIVMNVDCTKGYKLCTKSSSEPWSELNGQWYCLANEDSINGFLPTYRYSDVHEYSIGSTNYYDILYKYDEYDECLIFDGTLTFLGYKLFEGNVLLHGMASMTLYAEFLLDGVNYTRYLFNANNAISVYFVDNLMYIRIICDNITIEEQVKFIFETGMWYKMYITFSRYTGLMVFINGGKYLDIALVADSGNINKTSEFCAVGSYFANSYSPYKFVGKLKNLFVVNTVINEELVVEYTEESITSARVFIDQFISVPVNGFVDIHEYGDSIIITEYRSLKFCDRKTLVVNNIYNPGSFIKATTLIDEELKLQCVYLPPSYTFKPSSDVVKVPSDFSKYVFVADDHICYVCTRGSSMYVKTGGVNVDLYDVSDFYSSYDNIGSVYLGDYRIDSFSLEYRLIGEYAVESNFITGHNITSLRHNYNLLMSDCEEKYYPCMSYIGDYYYSVIGVDIGDFDYYDLDVNISYTSESLVIMNLQGLIFTSKLVSISPLEYCFYILRHNSFQLPQEIMVNEYVESFYGGCPNVELKPIKLYQSKTTMIGQGTTNFKFELSKDLFSVYRKREPYSLYSDSFTSDTMIYSFDGNYGNGISYITVDDSTIGVFSGYGYLVNKSFSAEPVWNIVLICIIELTTYKEFNPIWSFTTTIESAYQLAFRGTRLVFMFSKDSIMQEIDTGVDVPYNKTVMLGVFIDDNSVYIHLNSAKYKVDLPTSLQPLDGGYLYFGYGLDLNARSGYFVGKCKRIEAFHGKTSLYISDFYTSYYSEGSLVYDNLADIKREYLELDNTELRLFSYYTYNGSLRYLYIQSMALIGYDSEITPTSVSNEDVIYNYLLTYDLVQQKFTTFSEYNTLISATAPNGDVYMSDGTALTIETDTDLFKYINFVYVEQNVILLASLGGLTYISGDLEVKVGIENGISSLLVLGDYVYMISGYKLYKISLTYVSELTKFIYLTGITPLLEEAYCMAVYDDVLYVYDGDKIFTPFADVFTYTLTVDINGFVVANSYIYCWYKDRVLIIDVLNGFETEYKLANTVSAITVSKDTITITTYDSLYFMSDDKPPVQVVLGDIYLEGIISAGGKYLNASLSKGSLSLIVLESDKICVKEYIDGYRYGKTVFTCELDDMLTAEHVVNSYMMYMV